MRQGTIGETCTIGPFDWRDDDEPPDVGDVLFTAAGSAYRILQARHVRTRTPLPAGVSVRLRLKCLRIDPSKRPAGVRMIWLRWNLRAGGSS